METHIAYPLGIACVLILGFLSEGFASQKWRLQIAVGLTLVLLWVGFAFLIGFRAEDLPALLTFHGDWTNYFWGFLFLGYVVLGIGVAGAINEFLVKGER